MLIHRSLEIGQININDEYLRVLAFLFMVIDHIEFLSPSETIYFHWIMRGLGRLSLPIFIYLLVKGWQRARSIKNYFFRILQWGIISQIVIYIINIPIPNNILLMMAYCLIMLESCKFIGWQCLGLFCIGAELLNLEYGFYAILICYLMQFEFNKKFYFLWILIHIFTIALGFPKIQLLALIAPGLIESKHKKAKFLEKWLLKIPRLFWYAGYPIQWIVLAGLGNL